MIEAVTSITAGKHPLLRHVDIYITDIQVKTGKTGNIFIDS
jgi:hypothetical protein